MEHATALADDDATHPCSCAKLVAAGWQVRCFACGRNGDAQ